MTIPDSMFANFSWLEINIFMFTKRNSRGGVISVSLKRIADEFKTTRGKVYYTLHKLHKEKLLTNTLQTSCKHLANAPCTENQEVNKGLQTPHKHLTNTSQTVIERKRALVEKLKPYTHQYGSDMLNEFYKFWTEMNEGGVKMRFEMEKVFDISRRLARWKHNNYGKHSTTLTGMNIQNTSETDYEKGAERWLKK